MKCRLHYVLITYLCRSKYTPHTRTHSHTHTAHTHPARHTSHLCREPSNALHTLRRPSGKFLKHMCSLPPSFQAVPTSFCLTSFSLYFSLSLPSILQLMVGSCLLSSSFLVLLFLLFSLQFDAFACLLILVYLPSICIRSTCPLPPLPSAVAPSFKDKLNQFPIDRVMRCFFCSIFPWTLPQLPA